ncbi:MAG: ABC transporter permease subunit/CPBP intramembrane protease [Candidatus Eremiobacterota bacterium]
MRWPFNLRTISIIFKKEMKDTLRDRNILISQFLLPLVLYPLVVIITSSLFTGQIKKAEDSISRVYIFNSIKSPILSETIRGTPLMKEVDLKNPFKMLSEGKLELIIFIPDDYTEDPVSNKSFELKFHYNSTNELSMMARNRIDEVLKTYNDILIKNRLKYRALSLSLISPLKMSSETVSTKKREIGSMIGGILPFLIILFTITAGFLPALDVIVGEKERGTLETLLVSKITKSDIIIGKFMAVWATALMSTCLHLLSSTVTFATLAQEALAKLPISFTWTALMAVIFLMIPLTGFVCSAIMAVTMVAKSYKEGSNYLSALTLLMFMPLSIIFSPSMKATYATSIVPIFNVSILFRDILKGDFNAGHTIVTFLATFLYTSLILWIALKLFEQEDILFRETVDVSMPHFLSRQKVTRKGRFPSPSEALVLICIIFILFFFLGSRFKGLGLIGGVYMIQLLLIFSPCIIFLYFWKYDIKEILRIRRFSIGTILIAILLGLSGMVVTMQISAIQNIFFPFPSAEKVLGPLLDVLKSKNGVMDFIIKFSMIALLPALCEETLFRGVLQSTLEKHLKNKFHAIVFTALVFGSFHMSPYRFIPTMIIGLYLGYLAQRSKSIFPGMLVHAINNGLVYIAIYFMPENDPGTKWLLEEGSFLPYYIFIPGMVVFIMCIYLLKRFYNDKIVTYEA